MHLGHRSFPDVGSFIFSHNPSVQSVVWSLFLFTTQLFVSNHSTEWPLMSSGHLIFVCCMFEEAKPSKPEEAVVHPKKLLVSPPSLEPISAKGTESWRLKVTSPEDSAVFCPVTYTMFDILSCIRCHQTGGTSATFCSTSC